MEECRFETSELQASFMMATPLWSDSWSLCHVADRSRSIQIQDIAGIMYVALPEVEITQPDNLVVLEVAEDGPFSALPTSLPSDEPPPMVNGAILDLFVSSALHIQSQVCFLFFLPLFILFYMQISLNSQELNLSVTLVKQKGDQSISLCYLSLSKPNRKVSVSEYHHQPLES